jgi:hypothetical protein
MSRKWGIQSTATAIVSCIVHLTNQLGNAKGRKAKIGVQVEKSSSCESVNDQFDTMSQHESIGWRAARGYEG